jgi:hypothetical protein
MAVDENATRLSIITVAQAEPAKGVDANAVDPADPTKRKGWQQLKDYFDVAAHGIWSDDVVTKGGASGLPDWCGIFALWAIKKGGASWIGSWKQSFGISSVPGMTATRVPKAGDVTFMNAMPQHMSLVFSVPDQQHVTTIDGNNSGLVTGPSQPKPISSFDGFVTAFPSPVGTWDVHVGDWRWFYRFAEDGTARWTDISSPPQRKGGGTWMKIDASLVISWDTGSTEKWDLPLQNTGQKGELIGQGRIIVAHRLQR